MASHNTFQISHPFIFQHPTTILVSGPTMCGKTRFLVKALKDQLFSPPPHRILWIYGEWQPIYDEVKLLFPQIEFNKKLTDVLYESLDSTLRNLIILDDQMFEEAGSENMANIFTKGAHHRNLTVVFIIQNLFHQGKCMRTISLNSHYMVLFKNPRDSAQIKVLANQVFPQHPQTLVAAYSNATENPFGYLLLDLHPQTPEALRLRTGIFPSDINIVYGTYKSSITSKKNRSGIL